VQAMIGFLKTHLISLICGVAALAALGFAGMGMSNKTVIEKMNKNQNEIGAGNISSLRSTAKNQECIDQERKRAKAFEDDYKATVDTAKRINRREPLMGGVFPKAEQNATRFAFKGAYEKEVLRLASLMGAETLPTQYEIEEEQINVNELLAQEKEKKEETKIAGAPGQVTPPVVSAAPTPPPIFDRGGTPPTSDLIGGDFPGASRDFGRGSMPMQTGSSGGNVEPKYNAVYRARVNKARSIRCYVDPFTFQVNPLIQSVGAPPPEQMWYAQVSLWIQQDVVQAINALNREAAKSVQDGEAYVEHSPVKRLLSLRVLGYVLPTGGILPFPAISDAGSTAKEMTPSFTDRKSNEQFDVVRFELTAVVDSRETLKIVDAITKANFNKLLSIESTAVNRDLDEQQLGYFYGTAPVAQVRMEFETYMTRGDVFDEMKPAEVVQALSGQKSGG
jgi:hypothetical protein